MPASAQSALADEKAFALHERCGAAAYGMDREQFANILREIQCKYLPQATPDEAAEFCAALRLEELALARSCAAGNERAWQDFISRYRNKLRAIALHITRDGAHASDLADSLFADLYGVNTRDGVRHSKLTFYTARGSLEGWLRTVMAQEFINRYRKTKKDVSLDEQEEEGTQFVATNPPPAPASDARLEEATDEALGELSAEDRYVLAAYHLEGRTLAEIARTLGLHESSISRRLDRVTTTLRKRILACLRDRGMSHAQAKEALETDVRDLRLDLRARLAQDSGIKTFPGGGEEERPPPLAPAPTEAMSDAPKIVLDRLRAAAPGDAHPDADVLTAFAEQALSGAERESVVRHLSRCGDCREVVALSLPPSVDVQVKPQPVAEQTPSGQPVGRSRNWFAWPTLRWAALAASVVVVASVLLLNPGKQPGSTAGTEDATIPAKIQNPSSDAATNAMTSTRSEPQALPATTGSVAEKTVPRARRTASRDQQRLARAQTPAPAPPTSLADNKRLDSPRVDSLRDKDSLSYDTGRFAAKQPARSGMVARGELAAADQSGASANGMAAVSTAANEAPVAPAVGGLLAKNDAPVVPIEKAKPAVKEEADLKSQYQPAPTQNTLTALATESEVVARREKASAKQFKKISVPQWSLAQGKLQRSFDAGKTWQIALQLDRPVLTFGALGGNVWVGTQGGTIFHSTDGGATWATIQPATNAATLTTDIVAIEIRSTTEVLLTTSTGEFWTTSDAGKTWDKTQDKK